MVAITLRVMIRKDNSEVISPEFLSVAYKNLFRATDEIRFPVMQPACIVFKVPGSHVF